MLTFCLTATLFTIIPIRSSSTREYDPWLDYNDDGIIDMKDIYQTVLHYCAEGDPVNKTALLYNVNETFTELLSRIGALEARIPKKGYISIPPTAFTPKENTQPYYIYYNVLEGEGDFLAPLQLPLGVTLTKMTVYLSDYKTDGEIDVFLRGWNLTSNEPLGPWMAYVATSKEGTPGRIVLYDDTIDYATIDNNCIYSLWVAFTYKDLFLSVNGVVLEYEYPA
ncbi:MAG: hypothetical protein QW076_05970 [Candidatus Anstonellales archaeon]